MTGGLPQRLIRPLVRFVLRHWVRHEEIVRIRQQLRYLALAEILSRSDSRPLGLSPFELSFFSQNGEDGVLAEILRRIGAGGEFFVEVGASTNEANCLLLADVFGWSGIFLESDAEELDGLVRKYSGVPRVQAIHAHVTKTNFNSTLLKAGVTREFDVLSIDIDGNDYWLWDALTDYSPRVVIIEYNPGIEPSREVVQPYRPERPWDGTSFYGASLGALRRLAAKRGYRLVHVELTGTNAFFIRRDLAAANFPPEQDIIARGANHFLYGLRYEDRSTRRSYIDLTREENP
jgi:hypothetical protein